MGRRPLERVLAILGQVEAAGSQGGTPGHCKGGNGVLALWRVTGAMSLTRGQGGDLFWKPEKVVPPTYEAPFPT